MFLLEIDLHRTLNSKENFRSRWRTSTPPRTTYSPWTTDLLKPVWFDPPAGKNSLPKKEENSSNFSSEWSHFQIMWKMLHSERSRQAITYQCHTLIMITFSYFFYLFSTNWRNHFHNIHWRSARQRECDWLGLQEPHPLSPTKQALFWVWGNSRKTRETRAASYGNAGKCIYLLVLILCASFPWFCNVVHLKLSELKFIRKAWHSKLSRENIWNGSIAENSNFWQDKT